jgi:hypothetical protein
MSSAISLFIFIIVLFLYIHVNYQYKKTEDLEIYEFEYTDITSLQETCDVRQPIVFHFAPLIGKYAPINLEVLQAVEKEDGNILNIKDVHDYYKVLNSSSILPIKVPLSFQSVVQLIHADTATPHFFSENNHEFVEETGIDNVMTKIGNKFLRPSCSVNQTFDLMTASKGVGLPMRFHTQTRKYVYVSSGRIVVKMAPFKYAKKLDFNKQFLVSPMNCWKPQLQYIPYINKVRFLEFEVLEGYMLYIPPYWIYSIFYMENDTCLLEYNYQTVMNMVAHPDGVVRSFKNALQVLVDIVDSFGSGGSSISNSNTISPIGNGYMNQSSKTGINKQSNGHTPSTNERIAGASSGGDDRIFRNGMEENKINTPDDNGVFKEEETDDGISNEEEDATNYKNSETDNLSVENSILNSTNLSQLLSHKSSKNTNHNINTERSHKTNTNHDINTNTKHDTNTNTKHDINTERNHKTDNNRTTNINHDINTDINIKNTTTSTVEGKKKTKHKKAYNQKNGDDDNIHKYASATKNKTKIVTHSNTPYDLSAIIGITSS